MPAILARWVCMRRIRRLRMRPRMALFLVRVDWIGTHAVPSFVGYTLIQHHSFE